LVGRARRSQDWNHTGYWRPQAFSFVTFSSKPQAPSLNCARRL
jgi:hypothetical protein